MAATFLENEIMTHPELTESLNELLDLFRHKLWHQLTDKLLVFFMNPCFDTGKGLVPYYEKVIHSFEKHMNKLSLSRILVRISRQLDATEAIDFINARLESLGPVDVEPRVFLMSAIALRQLELGNTANCRENIEKSRELLEGGTGHDVLVSSAFYFASSKYEKAHGTHAGFFKEALHYISFTPLETLSTSENTELAYDLGIAALLSDSIYNFGELLQHPILEVLAKDPERGWMTDLLRGFNIGDFACYENLKKHVVPLGHASLIEEKLRIMAVIELVFRRKENDRVLALSDIAAFTKIDENAVELLLMRALSLGLIKGTIDQLDGMISITWVQPRHLDKQQIAVIRGRLDQWTEDIKATSRFVQSETEKGVDM